MDYSKVAELISQADKAPSIILCNKEMYNIVRASIASEERAPIDAAFERSGGEVEMQRHADVNTAFPTLVLLTRKAYERWQNASPACRWMWSAGLENCAGAEFTIGENPHEPDKVNKPEGMTVIHMSPQDDE